MMSLWQYWIGIFQNGKFFLRFFCFNILSFCEWCSSTSRFFSTFIVFRAIFFFSCFCVSFGHSFAIACVFIDNWMILHNINICSSGLQNELISFYFLLLYKHLYRVKHLCHRIQIALKSYIVFIIIIIIDMDLLNFKVIDRFIQYLLELHGNAGEVAWQTEIRGTQNIRRR